MKNKSLRALAVLLSLFCLFALPSCSDAGSGDASVPDDGFKPVADTGESSELYSRYEEYKENEGLAFRNFAETDAADFEYEITDDGVAITNYIGEGNIVVIPESINGSAVTKICTGAFSGTSLRAVYVPDTVKTIEKNAFLSCDGLKTLRLPFIGDGADNSFLGHIFGASEYGENAVSVPASLDMLILGEGCTEIVKNALRGCKTLSAVVLSDGIDKIEELAFYDCSDLVYVSLGDGVDEIGEYAFANCTSLFSINCSIVEKIGNGAFYSCTSINNITLKLDDGDYIGRIFGAESIEFSSDFVPISLRRVNIAEGCEEISAMAFASCKYITLVTFPETLKKIGVRAFYNCRSLSAVVIPDGVETIEDDAFFYCDALMSVELGSSLDSLGMQAFYGCKSLKEVTLPESLGEIKASAFYGCTALETVELGGVKTIGKDAFGKCSSLNPVSVDGIDVAEGNEALTGGTNK